MIIRAIRLRNFGLYAGEQVFRPSTSLDGAGSITLVGGLNGRGKTSLLEAVLLNLYGSRSPVVRASEDAYTTYLESLIHNGADRAEGSAVELDLEIPGDGDSHSLLRIRRSWRVANKRASEKLEVWRNSREDEQLATNWNTYVEELIPSGVSWLFFFDGEKIATLAEEEETSESLRIAIRSLLGLDLVDKLITDLDAVIRRNKARLRDAEGAEVVAAIEAEVESLERSADVIRQQHASKNNEVLRAEEARRKAEEEYYRAGGTLAESRSNLEGQRRELEGRLSEIRSEIRLLAAGAVPLLLVVPLLMQVSIAVESAAAVHQARAILPLVQKRDETLLNKLWEHIPDLTKLDVIKRFLEEDRAEMETLAARTPPIDLSAVGLGQLEALLMAGRTDLRERASVLVHEYHETEDRLEQVNRHLLYQFDQAAVNERLAELSKAAHELATKQLEKEQLQKRLHEVEGQLGVARQRHRSALEKFHQQLDDLDDAKRNIATAMRSQETLRAFRKEVTERKIHALETGVMTAFAELTHKTTLARRVRIHPETLQITLHVESGDEVLKSRLSSGEKQMLAVAILWGLARASGRDLPVIIDTPMGRLDSSHRMNFVTRYLPNASHQVIVLSTDTEIVGAYLDSLEGAVGQRYHLRFDEQLVRTTVEPGYFPTKEGITA